MKAHNQEIAVPTEVIEAKKGVDALLFRADVAAQVIDATTEAGAVEFLGEIKRQVTSIEAKRKFLVKPLQDHVKAINDEFKKITGPLDEAERTIKKGISDWRISEDFKEKENERLRIAAQGRHAAQCGDVERLKDLEPEYEAAAAVAPRTVTAGSTKASFRSAWKFEVEDELLVPRELCSPDDGKIRAAVKSGRRDIAGVRVYEEKSVAIAA